LCFSFISECATDLRLGRQQEFSLSIKPCDFSDDRE